MEEGPTQCGWNHFLSGGPGLSKKGDLSLGANLESILLHALCVVPDSDPRPDFLLCPPSVMECHLEKEEEVNHLTHQGAYGQSVLSQYKKRKPGRSSKYGGSVTFY